MTIFSKFIKNLADSWEILGSDESFKSLIQIEFYSFTKSPFNPWYGILTDGIKSCLIIGKVIDDSYELLYFDVYESKYFYDYS